VTARNAASSGPPGQPRTVTLASAAPARNRTESAATPARSAATLATDEALITSWRRLLDFGTLQKGEENLAGTARQTVAVISPKRATAIGVITGDRISISNSQGSVVLPVLVEDIHDDAVWAPRNSRGSELLAKLGNAHGGVVKVVKA